MEILKVNKLVKLALQLEAMNKRFQKELRELTTEERNEYLKRVKKEN